MLSHSGRQGGIGLNVNHGLAYHASGVDTKTGKKMFQRTYNIHCLQKHFRDKSRNFFMRAKYRIVTVSDHELGDSVCSMQTNKVESRLVAC